MAKGVSHVVKHLQISPKEGGASFALTNAGGPTRTFALETNPDKGIIFANCRLAFDALIGNDEQTVTAYRPTATGMIMYALTCTFLQKITLQTVTGVVLDAIDRCDMVMRQIILFDTPMNEFLTYDTYEMGIGNTYTKYYGKIRNFIRPSNAEISSYRTAWIGLNRGTHTVPPQLAEKNYIEPTYYFYVTKDNADKATGTRRFVSVDVPMSIFKHSLWQNDDVIIFNQPLQLQLYFNARKYIGYVSKNPLSNVGKINAAALNLSCNISNLYFYQAVEQNEALNAFARQQMMQGFTVTTERTTLVQEVLTGTRQVFSLRFNPTFGPSLLRVYAAVWMNNETNPATLYNFSNVSTDDIDGGNLICSSYYAKWRGERTPDYNLDVSNDEDWVHLKEHFDGSVVSTMNMFRHNRIAYLAFTTRPYKTWQKIPADPREGFVLEGTSDYTLEYVYTMESPPPSGYNHVAVVVGRKYINITSTGITVI